MPYKEAVIVTPDQQIRTWKDRSPLPGLIWPDYSEGCITHISEIVRQALGRPARVPSRLADFAAPCDHVILLIADGLGHHALARFREESAVLESIAATARMELLTSTFPSTTPAALTSLYLGAAPREHGLAGGNLYLRERGGGANMIRFSPMDDPRRDVFLEGGLDLKAFCPVPTTFEKLGRKGTRSAWVPASIRDNALCRICTAGASVRPFLTPAQAVVGLRKTVQTHGTSFQCLYWDATDPISHARGPYSEEFRAEVVSFFTLLERELLNAGGVEGKVRVLLTADHGHALVKRTGVVTLEELPEIRDCLMAPPLGGTRVAYLLALPGKEEELKRACGVLEDRFLVLDSREMLDRGLFGVGAEHPEVRHRIGTLMLVPRDDATFHRTNPTYFTAPVRGDHDGLSAEEMAVPLLMWDIGR